MRQAKSSNTFHFKAFSHLDDSPEADYLINSMDIMMSLASIQAIKQRAIAAMHLKSGDKVLEVGCGLGQGAELIGQVVGDTGAVVAVDVSQRMIKEAKKRATQSNVQYLVANANALNYPDHNFCACYADRLLVSQTNKQVLFKELIRMVKPEGIICITDVDALSIIMAPYNQTTKIILELIHQSFVNPYIGRQLPELFIQNNLQGLTIIPEISYIHSFKTLSDIFQFNRFTEQAVSQGKLTIKEARLWFQDMHQAEKMGKFIYCITLFTVLGTVPKIKD